jgi:hypothetical protein
MDSNIKYYKFPCGCIAIYERVEGSKLHFYYPVVKACDTFWCADEGTKCSPEELNLQQVSKTEVAIARLGALHDYRH